MKPEHIKPIPKHILEKILRLDTKHCPEQKGAARLYSYLTQIKGELVKITVAVVTKYNKRHYKQVAAHGVKSAMCYVKDFEYNYIGMGYRVGWHEEGLYKYAKWFEYKNWCSAESKYYNAWSTTVNPEFVDNFPEYRYSAYRQFDGKCVIQYLKLYEKYPQTEYLVKLGLQKLHDSVTVLKRIAKDKAFCKWLIAHKTEIAKEYCYVWSIMQSYKTGKPIKQIQAFAEYKKKLETGKNFAPIKELFKGKDLERFFLYLDKQNSDPSAYADYLKACNYLGLDMTQPKNRFPHDLNRWHDLRINEYHSAKALADEKERAELYTHFATVAEKYLALQKKKGCYAVMIAKSPAELMREGELLHHCVGKMGYDQKTVRQESLIFFVRCVESPDTPFVTIEYSLKSKRVLQCYGKQHARPDDNVLHFVNNVWLPYANRTIKKLVA